jgi:hypothetical protein
MEEIEKETDVVVIAQLLLDWLEHLSEPVLPESFMQSSANSLQAHKEICLLFREVETFTLSEAESILVSKQIIELTDLPKLPAADYRTLALIISFLRNLLVVRTYIRTTFYINGAIPMYFSF